MDEHTMSASDTNKAVSLRHYSTEELLRALMQRGDEVAALGKKQSGQTIRSRAQYLLDHMPGAVLAYKPQGR